MPLSHNGLVKLVEEIGELQAELGQLQQVAAKAIQYPSGDHPDGGGSLQTRLELEMADVMAAINIVTEKLNLNREMIQNRAVEKLKLYRQWSQEL